SPDIRSVPDIKYHAQYVESGYFVYGRDSNVMAQRFDLQKMALVGDPVSIARSVAYSPSLAATSFSAASTGVVVYRTGGPWNEVQLKWYDRSGKENGTIGAGVYVNLKLSHDGRRLALDRADAQTGLRDIWAMSLDRAVPSRLT